MTRIVSYRIVFHIILAFPIIFWVYKGVITTLQLSNIFDMAFINNKAPKIELYDTQK